MRLRYIWPAILLVAVACNGDSDATPTAEATEAPTAVATEAPATEATTTAATDAPGDEGGTIAGLPAECAQVPYDLEIRKSGDGDSETFTVVDAEDAGRNVREDGAVGYKIFLTDFKIDDERDLIDQIFPDNLPAGATLITLDVARVADPDDPTPVTDYPNVAAGEELVAFATTSGPDSLGIGVTIANAEGVTADSSVNATATGEVLYADDTAVCLDVTIESESGFQLSGIVTARVR